MDGGPRARGSAAQGSPSLNERLRGNASVEIRPHVLREIVQLAAPYRVPVVTPGEHFGIQPLVEGSGEAGLSLLETVEGNTHIHVVGAVLENVVDQTVERPHELDV